jgi:hypothetical protein
MATSGKARVRLVFVVDIETEYGITQLRARVMYLGDEEELHYPDYLSGPAGEYRGLRVRAYVGDYDGRNPGRVWGCAHEFAPSAGVIDDAREAENMVKAFRRIARGMDTANRAHGYLDDGDFTGYLTRVAQSLGITEYRVRNTERVRATTGNAYRSADGSGVQTWAQYRVTEHAEARGGYRAAAAA